MRRSEFEDELRELARQVKDHSSGGEAAARARLLSWFDGVQGELGYLGAVRAQLSEAIGKRVEAEVEVEYLRGLLKVAEGGKSRLVEDDD